MSNQKAEPTLANSRPRGATPAGSSLSGVAAAGHDRAPGPHLFRAGHAQLHFDPTGGSPAGYVLTNPNEPVLTVAPCHWVAAPTVPWPVFAARLTISIE